MKIVLLLFAESSRNVLEFFIPLTHFISQFSVIGSNWYGSFSNF